MSSEGTDSLPAVQAQGTHPWEAQGVEKTAPAPSQLLGGSAGVHPHRREAQMPRKLGLQRFSVATIGAPSFQEKDLSFGMAVQR